MRWATDTDIAVDCHWRYNASDMIKVARELEPFRLLWLEDPVPPNNTAALKELSSKVRVPIATGENLFFFEGFQEIIAAARAKYCYPRFAKSWRVGCRSKHCTLLRMCTPCPWHLTTSAARLERSPQRTSARRFLISWRWSFMRQMCLSGTILLDGPSKPVIQDGFISCPITWTGSDPERRDRATLCSPGEPFFE